MPLQQLQQLIHTVEPAALLIEPRVMRRVIRLDQGLQGFRLLVPHRFSYTIERDRLLAFVELGELGVPPSSDLPRRVILLPKPDEDQLKQGYLTPEQIEHYARLLFHERVHLELENNFDHHPDPDGLAAERIAQIGLVEFAEIRKVLASEDALFLSPGDADVYIEFAAQYLEQRYFSPQDLRSFFPAIRDYERADQILQQDLDHARLYERMKFPDDHPLIRPTRKEHQDSTTGRIPILHQESKVSLATFRQMQSKAERTSALGNGVKAALSHLIAAQRAPAGYEAEARTAAQLELERLSQRLRAALQLSEEEAEQWCQALQPLLPPAAVGFWSNEARLLYDLQKVCVEQEKGIYRLDLIEWIRTWGRRPIRRPLPLMRDALMLRHLRTIRRRVSVARITREERVRIENLLDQVLPQIEFRSRNRLRIIIEKVLDESGFVTENIPEQVARRKIVEELLDRIVERGYLSMTDLRDAISKNDLKLPDISTVKEIAFGDILLKADRRFDASLDGVYRRGAIYQRWPQTLSSLFFGTNSGRFVTKHLFIPFGGAYLVLEFFKHLFAMISGKETHAEVPMFDDPLLQEAAHEIPDVSPDWGLMVGVLLLGTWISLLIHHPTFRARNIAFFKNLWSAIWKVLFEVPAQILRSEYVQRILSSRSFQMVRSYGLEPGFLVVIISLIGMGIGIPWSNRLTLDVFLVTALFLNSPVGRYLSEVTTDFLVRAWQELQIHVFSAVVQWIMDLFDSLQVALDRMVYAVDEWLRFRAGESRMMRVVKLGGGVVWFFVSYVVMFVFILLIEPQINPIKHFPVVTVSHKLILPTGPMFAAQLTPYLGTAKAQTLVWTTIWLIPGVFGFLVWELKENWRLYAANRPRKLRPDAIGSHGETMMRFLRVGFHSGTLPKTFAALRRVIRKSSRTGENRRNHKWTKIHHAEESIQNFGIREFLHLLEESSFSRTSELSISHVRAATNRIDMKLMSKQQADPVAVMTWEYIDDKLVFTLRGEDWINDLNPEDQTMFREALAGLLQRSGAEELHSLNGVRIDPPYSWDEWVALWSEKAKNNDSPVMGHVSDESDTPSLA